MKTTKLLGGLLAGVLLLAACGDDGAGSNEFSEALAEMLKAEPDNPFTDGEIDCLAAEMVDAVGGPSTLEDAGISPEDVRAAESISELDLEISDEQGEELARSFGDCDISLVEAIFDELGGRIPDDVKDCLADNITDDGLADVFADALISGDRPSADDLPPELMTAFTECVPGAS